MIKVGLVTNWQEACAVAEYANSLMMHVKDEDISIKIIQMPMTYEQVISQARDVDVLHFNYAYWVFKQFGPEQWYSFRPKLKKPILITLHESNEEVILAYCQKDGLGPAWDLAVVHEEVEAKRFVHIPQPIRMVEGLSPAKPQKKIGVHGFPFSWKNFQAAAYVANKLGIGFMALLGSPKSDRLNISRIAHDIMDVHPSAEIELGWLPYDYMVRRLRECTALIYPYSEDGKLFGVSAGVRAGMASGRPVIVSKHRQQFRDLCGYEDEIYRIDSQNLDSIEQAITTVLNDTANECERKPGQLLKDMSWSECATKYVDLYKQLAKPNLNEEEKDNEQIKVG